MSSNLNQISSTGDFSSPDPKPKIAISYFSTLLLKCPFNFQEREKNRSMAGMAEMRRRQGADH